MLSVTPDGEVEPESEPESLANRKALTLDSEYAEAVMHTVGVWVQLATRELESGHMLSGADVARLELLRIVVEDWIELGGGGLALP